MCDGVQKECISVVTVKRKTRDVKQKIKGRSGAAYRQTGSWCLCYIICLLGGPQLFVLLASKALVIVSFAFEKLLEVGFAVKLSLKGCKGAKAIKRGKRKKYC